MAAVHKKVIVVDSKSAYDKLVNDAGPNKHILVEFYATWCGPCAMIGPRLEQLATEYSGRMIILKIDVDQNEDLAIQYEISSMPTFLIIKNRVTLIQFVGSNVDRVLTTVEKYVGKADESAVKTGTKPNEGTGTQAPVSKT
ncbi:thioredoxin-2 [Drosophila rhopaloa]|uniref:Thioredoxin-1 n=1 Tax=Drosophila rhopaloa TaxID=1041015 RepID=A0A6P4E4G8_DRORH|nr:thioredoxin-2 [Drosophila rhopaloa]